MVRLSTRTRRAIMLCLGLIIGAAGCRHAPGDVAAPLPSLAANERVAAGEADHMANRADAYKGPVSFDVQAEGLSTSFIDHSSGGIDAQQWVFGDGATSTAASPVHAYSREGTYDVTETVSDASGRSSARTVRVRVLALPPELKNGLAREGLSAVQSYDLNFYARPPAGAKRLEFELSGGVGDVELFVRRGSAPTDESYDCHRPLDSHVVICAFDLPAAGPYYVRLLARKTFAAASLKASWLEPSTAGNQAVAGALHAKKSGA